MGRIQFEKGEEVYCDHCGEYTLLEAASIDFGYGSNFDMDEKVFCSDMCLLNWCKINIKRDAVEEAFEKVKENFN